MAEFLDLLTPLVSIPPLHRVGQFSSRNKQGENADRDWPAYVDEHGDAVIFDETGPGVIRSMWGTELYPEMIVKFYFDGESTPSRSLPLIEFYKGADPDFTAPLVTFDRRGHYGDNPFAGNCFVPIPFKRSLKISVQGNPGFYHILYNRFAEDAPVESFTGREDNSALLDAFKTFHQIDGGGKSAQWQTEERFLQESPPNDTSGIGQPWIGRATTMTLFEREGGGVIHRLEIECDGGEDFLRQAQLRMVWDDHRMHDVHAPLGMFFALGDRRLPLHSLPLAAEPLPDGRIRVISRWPMPFWKSAKIELQNLTDRRVGAIKVRIDTSATPPKAASGCYFTTQYREGHTVYDRDWILYERQGAGWYVGSIQSMFGAHYCEGDEHFTIDRAISPQINGTGTEDYYLFCYWPSPKMNTPVATCNEDVMLRAGGYYRASYGHPAVYGRFHLEAPIPFFEKIDARIQHGARSDVEANYRSLGVAYLRPRAAVRCTDFLDVANAASEAMHAYKATDGEIIEITGAPEGQDCDMQIAGRGRVHRGGTIQFEIAVDSQAQGVRLRRRLDQAIVRQEARVFVDDQPAGTWLHAYANETLRWYDSDFDLPASLTQGKSRLSLRLELVEAPANKGWTDFEYKVFCYAS